MIKKKQKKVVTESKINFFTIFVGIGGLAFLYVSYFLINDGLQEPYPQIWPIGLGVFFGIFCILCFIALYTYDKVYIPKTEKKKSIYLSKIKSKTYFAIAFLLIGFFSIYSSLKFYIVPIETISSSDLTTITDVITNKVEINKGAKGSRSILLSLKKYADFKFKITGNGFDAMNTDKFVNNLKQGDTISLSITTEEFNKKITKKKELDFYDKTINYGFITVIGVTDKDQNYLNVYDYNQEIISDKPWNILIPGVFGLLLVGIAIYLLKLKENPS